jgi:acetyltransferase-like isoleucine patch superfamily enzyme
VGIEVGAEIILYKDAMNGRPGYRTGIRPNHKIRETGYIFFGEITFGNDVWLKPGGTIFGKINCVIACQDRPLFKEGYYWPISDLCRK